MVLFIRQGICAHPAPPTFQKKINLILYNQALEGKNVRDLLSNVGSGGGAAAVPAVAGEAGGAAAAETKEEEKEEGKQI